MLTKSSQRTVNGAGQQPLWLEDWRDGVRAIGYRMGGMKALALSLWPTKGHRADVWLSDCLNPDRSAKLDPDEFLLILELGHRFGVHVLMHYMADVAHYQRPSPVEPEDQRAALQRQFLDGLQTLTRLAKALGAKL